MRMPSAALALGVSIVLLAGCQAVTSDSDSAGSGTTSGETTEESSSGGGAASCVDPVLADGPATGGEIAVTATSMDPATLEVAVGDVVAFTAGDSGIYGVAVGSLDEVTVTGGLVEYYRFDGAGTCEVSSGLSSGTATIVVG